jgi:hypothetical protein
MLFLPFALDLQYLQYCQMLYDTVKILLAKYGDNIKDTTRILSQYFSGSCTQ